MSKIITRTLTALEVQNGMDIQSINTGKAYFNVRVRPCADDPTLILIEDTHGNSTVLGASSAVFLLTDIALTHEGN